MAWESSSATRSSEALSERVLARWFLMVAARAPRLACAMGGASVKTMDRWMVQPKVMLTVRVLASPLALGSVDELVYWLAEMLVLSRDMASDQSLASPRALVSMERALVTPSGLALAILKTEKESATPRARQSLSHCNNNYSELLIRVRHY